MVPIQIQLLGGFRVTNRGLSITGLRQGRVQALLAYLLLHRDVPQSRRQIANTLWPDSSEAQARTNLRRELHHLRHVLPEGWLQIEAEGIWWRPDQPYDLDVGEFERCLAEAQSIRGTGPSSRIVSLLAQAVDLYRGPLLPECYDEWLLAAREALAQRYASSLEQLASYLEDQRAYADASRYAELLLRQDPLMEAAYRRLMRLYALNGERARALRVYQACCSALAQELGVEPGPETEALYHRLLDGESTQEAVKDRQTLVDRTPLIGRQDEWQFLLDTWRYASRGHACLTVISGEAGIGKSRLAEDLLVWAQQQGFVTAKARAYAAEGDFAFSPVTELLRAEELHTRWSRLADVWKTELARLVPELRESEPHLLPPEPLTEPWQRRQWFEAVARAILTGGEARMLLIDDLQWCDQDTLACIQFLLRFSSQAKLLVLGTVRSEEIGADHPLAAVRTALQYAAQWREIELARLSEAETAALAAQIAGRVLSAAQIARLHHETEGVPLFIVETVRAEEGTRVVPPKSGPESSRVHPHGLQSLPPKIHAVIHARLLQLSQEAQRLVSLAAIIGRSFTLPVLVAASQMDEEALLNPLDESWRRRIFRSQGADTYDFSHDRIQDVAYAEVSPIMRPQLHRRVAEALVRIYAGDLDAVAAQVAVHFQRAGMVELALEWHRRAADAMEQLQAHAGEILHLEAALDLNARLPESPARSQVELSLLLALARNVRIARGFTVPEIETVLERARHLLAATDEPQKRFEVLGRLADFHFARQGLDTARTLAEETLEIAQKLDDRASFDEAYYRSSRIHFHLGQIVRARDELETLLGAVSTATPLDLGNPPVEEAESIGSRYASLALLLWMAGFPDQARTTATTAITLAEQYARPFSHTNTLFVTSVLFRELKDVEMVRRLADGMLSIGAQYDLPVSKRSGTVCTGWVAAQHGDYAEAIRCILPGIQAFREASHTMYQTHRLGMLAGIYLRAGDMKAAEAILQEALEISAQYHERWWDAELLRLQGDLLQARSESPVAVEASYCQALDLARDQQAKSLELRAAVSLAQFWLKQGQASEAKAMVEEVLSWFTEGFDTPDLLSARSFLDELTVR